MALMAPFAAQALSFRDSLITEVESATRMALESGTKLGPYEISGHIGSGGMGPPQRSHRWGSLIVFSLR